MNKLVFKYGFIGGVVSSFLGTFNWFFIAPYTGVEGSQMFGYLSIAVSLLCIPLGVRYFRDKLNNHTVSIAQALKIGLGITVIASLVMAFHSVLFFAFQKEAFLEWQREGLNAAELAEFNNELAQMPDFAYTPWFQGIVMFFMVFLIGAVVNFLSALFLKKSQH